MLLDTGVSIRTVTGQAPKINWSHPLARDLRIAAVYGRLTPFSLEAIQPFRNTIQYVNNPNAWGNTGRSYSPKYGAGLNSGGGSATIFASYANVASNTKSTCVFIGKLSTSTTGQYITGLTNQFVNGWHIAESFGGVAGNVGLNAFIGAGYISSPTSVTVDTTNIHCIAAVNAGTGASNTIKLYVDGVLKDTWSPGGNAVFDGNNVYDPMPNGSRHTYFQFIYARELSTYELQALQENPWQIFAPQKSLTAFLPSTFSYSRPIADLSNAGWVRVP